MDLAEWIESVEPLHDDSAEDSLETLRLCAESCREALGDDSPALPVKVTKSLAGRMFQCEAYALAPSQGESWSQLKGALLDVFVACVAGGHPVRDVMGDLTDAVAARGDERLLERLDSVDTTQREELVQLAIAANTTAVDPRWQARTEVGHSVTIDGALTLSGRMDLVLGGLGTDRPTICVENKSGSSFKEHWQEAYFYSLMWFLRTGESPDGLALWYPSVGLVPIEVPGSAGSAARRVTDVVNRLLHIQQGESPSRTAGPQCGWCPISDGCNVGQQRLGADRSLSSSGESTQEPGGSQ